LTSTLPASPAGSRSRVHKGKGVLEGSRAPASRLPRRVLRPHAKPLATAPWGAALPWSTITAKIIIGNKKPPRRG
jgi:hypothetical protein